MIASRIDALLQSRWLFYVGAVAVTYMFWWSGLTKLWAQEHVSIVGGLVLAAIVADLRSRQAKG